MALKGSKPAKADELEVWVRLKNVKELNECGIEAFQPELALIQGDTVLKRDFVDKPDVAEVSFHKAMSYVDPREKEGHRHFGLLDEA